MFSAVLVAAQSTSCHARIKIVLYWFICYCLLQFCYDKNLKRDDFNVKSALLSAYIKKNTKQDHDSDIKNKTKPTQRNLKPLCEVLSRAIINEPYETYS